MASHGNTMEGHVIYGVSDGNRTRGLQGHNLAL